LAGHEHGLKHVEIVKDADQKENLPPPHTLHVIVSGAAAEMEECMYPKHISDMGKYVKIWYSYKFLIIFELFFLQLSKWSQQSSG
jgi:hypothetical protein